MWGLPDRGPESEPFDTVSWQPKDMTEVIEEKYTLVPRDSLL